MDKNNFLILLNVIKKKLKNSFKCKIYKVSKVKSIRFSLKIYMKPFYDIGLSTRS